MSRKVFLGDSVLYRPHVFPGVINFGFAAVVIAIHEGDFVDLTVFMPEGHRRVTNVKRGTEEGNWEFADTMQPERTRGFEVVSDECKFYSDEDLAQQAITRQLPRRGTKASAGYDFYALESASILPGQTHVFPMDIKAYMQDDEVLHFYPRSSVGIKLGLMIANTIPTVDADYYSNEENDGNITIVMRNISDKPVTILAGDRIVQGVFEKYLVADDEPEDLPERRGGIGHTGK